MTTMLLPNPHDLLTVWDDPSLRQSDQNIGNTITCNDEMIAIRAKVYQAFQAIIETTKHTTIEIKGAQSSETPIGSRVLEDRQLKAVRSWLAFGRIASTALSGLSGILISGEAFEYCLSKGPGPESRITLEDLSASMNTIRECFSVIGSPLVNLVRDPEIDNVCYLIIEIQVRGGVKENVKAHRDFAGKAAKLLGVKRENLTLHYDII
jgi:hypothetical protein